MSVEQAWKFVEAWHQASQVFASMAVGAWGINPHGPTVERYMNRAWRARVRYRMALARWSDVKHGGAS